MELSGATYIRADVAPSKFGYLRTKFPSKHFELLNISEDVLLTVDLIFCRNAFM